MKLMTFREDLIQQLKDPELVEAYLKVALEEYEEDGNLHMFLKAIRNVAMAQGGMAALAERTHMQRQSLYKALSDKGNPRMGSLFAIMHALGYRFSVERIEKNA